MDNWKNITFIMKSIYWVENTCLDYDEVAVVQSKWSEKVNKSIIGIMEMKSHKRHPVCGVDLCYHAKVEYWKRNRKE